MKKLFCALVAGAVLSCASTGFAMDFPATPLNSGAPTNLPGETIIPGMTQAMQVVNGVTQPILQPLLAPGASQPQATERAPRRRMMRRSAKRSMMKRRMARREMMQKSM